MDDRELSQREITLVGAFSSRLRGRLHERASNGNGRFFWAGCFAAYIFGGFLVIWWLFNVLLGWGNAGIALNVLVGALLLARLTYVQGVSNGLKDASGFVSELEYDVEQSRFWHD
jgi:hypothetical protein